MKKVFAVLAFSFITAGFTSAAPVNTTCPVGSRPARADITSNYQGKEIAFCCNKCKAKFDAEPAKYTVKEK